MFGQKEIAADLEVFSIYDTKSESYGMPQMAKNALLLIREYENQFPEMMKQKSLIATHPEDYILFKVGSFTFKTGKLKTCDPTSVIGFHEIKNSAMSRVQALQPPTLVPPQQ